jgi:hypothetical protein
MKVQRDKLQQYQKKISVIASRETEIARECLRHGDKKKALVALRRKKYQESLLANTDGQLERLEVLVNDVEFAKVQKDVLYGLQQGTTVLKMMQKEMGGVEGVEQLLGEAEEARAYSKVRLRIKWRRVWHKRSDIPALGGERDVGGSYVECGRGRGRGGVGAVRKTGQWGQRGHCRQDRGAARSTDDGFTAESFTEREMGEESEGARRSDAGGMIA